MVFSDNSKISKTENSVICSLNFTGKDVSFPSDKTEGVITAKVKVAGSLYTTKTFNVKYTGTALSPLSLSHFLSSA